MTTQTTTEAVCDRCGFRAELYVRDGERIELPFRWVSVLRSRMGDDPQADTMDLCHNCADAFEDWRVNAPAVPA